MGAGWLYYHRYSPKCKCPKCGKKGRYEVQGYDPAPERGRLFMCRYCNYHERASAKYGLFSAENEAIEEGNDGT